MCINPLKLADGQEVACHHCWQCVRRKIDDWTGRCIAESTTALGAHSVTLTYGRDRHYNATDHVRAALLTYSDVQKYLRAWRGGNNTAPEDRYGLRYFVVGEYGSMKGRAHWHCLLFWTGDKVPKRELGRNIDCPMWPHGHSFWQEGSPETVRYVAKYIAKEVETNERQYHMGLSRYPPLGDKFFRRLAQAYVDQRLAPQDLFYSFDGVVDGKGRKKQFQIQGKSRENFLGYFVRGWWNKYCDHPPNSELLEQYEDREARRGSQDAAERVLAAEKAGMVRLGESIRPEPFTGLVHKPMPAEMMSWMVPERLHFSEMLNVWLYDFEGGQRPWYWAKNEQGEFGWRGRIGVDPVTEAKRSFAGIDRYLTASSGH